MKILWICGSKTLGGAEQVTIQVLDLLQKRSHSVGALLPIKSPVRGALERSVWDIYKGNLSGSKDSTSIASIVRAVKLFQPEVVLVTTSREWLWSCLISRRLLSAPLILVRHMSLKLSSNAVHLANRRADAVIAVSESVRQNLLGRSGIRIDLVRVIRNPVRFRIRDEIPSRRKRANLRESMGLKTTGRWVGFFGGNDPQKGIGDLMEAAQLLRSRGIDLNLLVAGRRHPRRRRTVAGWAAQAGLSAYTHHLGEVLDMERALSAVDAVVMPTHSSLGEGLPLTALEAMACGTPLVGYDISGIREAIGAHEEGGLLVKPDDPVDLAKALEHVFTEPEQSEGAARRALQWARRQFDPARAADEYENLLLSLV